MGARDCGFGRMNLAGDSKLPWQMKRNSSNCFTDANSCWTAAGASLNEQEKDSTSISRPCPLNSTTRIYWVQCLNCASYHVFPQNKSVNRNRLPNTLQVFVIPRIAVMDFRGMKKD